MVHMAHKQTVTFTDPQTAYVREQSALLGISFADVVRRCIDRYREEKIINEAKLIVENPISYLDRPGHILHYEENAIAYLKTQHAASVELIDEVPAPFSPAT